MVDPIKDKILKRLQEGQTLEEIKQRVIDAGGWNSAVERSFAEAQDEFQKKNSTSEQPSTSEETSMESPSTIDGAQPTEEVSSDSDSDNQVVRFAKLDRIQAENAALWEEANKIQEVSKKDEVTDEDVLDFMGATPEPNFFQKLFGIEAEEDQALQDAVGTRTINKVILESEAKKVKETEEDVNQTYERLQNVNAATLNELWKDASPESAPLYNEVVDENGDTKLELSYKTSFDLQKQLREKEQFELERVAEKQKDVEAISDALPAGRFIYDLGTGVLDLGNSFLTFFDTEAAQTALYDSQFRTQASYNAAGLTEEEIKQGLYQNLEEGDWSNFGKLFSTQMAQTTPQLAAQAAIAYATRGYGASTAMWSSSAFMGLSTFGRTYAQTNGLVDSETQFIMSLGDAVVETMSERVFASDVKLAAGIEQGFKGMTRSQIRRELFQKGVISKEMKNLLGAEAKVFASSAVEEGFEELLAGFGSAVVHGIANNEEINAYEILDGMIVGFGMGGASAGKRNSIRLLSGGASAMGFGGFRSDLIKTQGAKQKLAAELRNTRDSSKAAIIQSKIDELNKIELATRAEQNKIYDSYSDEDAETTVKANQTLKKAISESRTETDPKKKAELKKTATEALNTIKEIEGKYEGEIAQFRQERKAIGSINYGKDKRIDLNATEDMQGSKIMQSLKNVAKALGSPVFAYGSYNDMAEALGVNIEEVSNSRGIFESKDGSIHIMTPAALDNTAFHEGIHKIARGVDSKYIQRFVDAAIDGMPEGLAEKYSDFAKQYEGDKDLYYEELFAEMSADIATGAISIEGFGGSLASAAMRPVIKTIQKAGMLTNKNTASFSEFVEYVQSVTNSFKKGERIEVDSPVRKMHDKLAGLMSQLVSPKTEMKSPAEIYGDFDPSKSSTFANMTTDGNGNFVFLHVSPNKFDAVDPTRVGSNLATSGEETRQINAARAGGVSMFYTASEDVDVVGSNRYHYTVDPSKVYNGVDDSQGLYEMAKSQIEAMGLGAAQNTVYAKMTQIANQMGYDMVVMPWKDGSLKAQTTKRLPVEEAQQSYKSNKSQWTAVKGKTFDARRVMNDTANALYDKIRDIAEISESIKEQVRKYGFQSMDGRFGAPSSFADFLSSMQKLADGLDPANAAVFNQSIEEARGQESSEDVSGYSTRKQSAEARKKLEENISKEFEGETMGFTFDPITGEAVFVGIAVADGINENVLGDPNKGISPEVLDKINQEALKNPKGNVGGWIQDGEFFLDVSEVYDIEATAYRLGDERGEIGIYNIGEQKYIEIDRSKSDAKSEAQKEQADEVTVEPSNESIRPPSPTLMRQAMSLKEQLEEMGLDPVEVMVEQMNRIGNEAKIDYKYKKETEPESDKINLADLKRRTGKTYKGLNYKDWQGIPMIFSISDQLTTGDVVNPYTGNLITNLMGGLGFHGASKKHSKLGWANIEDQKALDQINSAKEVYRKNKEVYDKAWESGKIPRGHVLMGIVRMGNSSMESNEAVLRVLYDNLTDFPLENKQKALKAFVERANNIIKENEQAIETGIGKKGEKLTRATIKQKQTANEHLRDILANIESQGITDISQTLNTKFLKGLKTIAAVAQLSNNITYGGAFTVGEENPKAGKPTKAPAAALLEGLPESERRKVHLGYVMDVITEPQMRNVPQRSLAMLTSIDITENGGLGESDHPNYPAAAKGKVIGIFKNPESVVNLFPEIQSQLALFAAFEGVKGKKMSTSKRFTQRVPVQAGLANIEFRGASIKLNPTNAERLSTILYRAFPDFKLSTGVDVFTELINNSTAMNKMKTASGKIWGVRRGNRIFINEDVHNSESELFNTKINEMGQIWINYLSVKTDPKSKAILEKGFELTRGTKEYKEQLKKHKGNEELALVDALSALIATKGQSIVDAVKRSNFKDWVLGMFAYIKSALIPSSSVKKEQIENMTLNEFLNMAITDVMGGLTFKATEKQKGKAQVNIDSRESTIMRQAGVYQYIKDLVEMGFKKSEIVQEMLDLGYTKADAELVYQKALSYNQGSKAGYRAGVKDRNARFVEERKERLKNEREEAKLWRKRAKELYRREKRVTDAMVDEAIKFLTGLKGVSIKPAQVKAILRMMKSANNKIHGNGAKQARNYGIFVSFVDAVAAVIDKQIEAKNLEEHSKLIRKVTAQQKKLMGRVKKLSPSSRSPIASYINQITDLASVDAGLLSFESLQTLANALNDLENTAKAVGVKTTKEGKVLSKPYIYIESIDDYVDVRKAKVYFDEIFAEINVEAEQRLEAMLMEQAVKMSIDNGGNWLSIYQELLRQRDMTPIQKKLEAIADELGLDLNDVDGLLAALDKLEEQKQEDKKETRDVIIDDAIMSTFEKWRTLLMSNEDFAMIFGFDEDADFDSAMRKSRARLEKLTLTELKKLEFFMFDFIANGKTYGLQSLSAVAVAKNEGNARLRELKMTASETTGAGSSVREGYYKLFETTPTFFRRIFKRYSQASVAQFMNAIGFGSMRNNVAQAEAKAAAFAKMVQNMLSNKKLDNQKSQTRMLIYSVLSQKPEGVTDAAWVIQLKNSMDIAITNDKRLSDDDIKQIKEAMELFGTGTTSKNLSDIMSELEKDTDLVEAVGIIRDMFKSQEPRIKDYAENFLGMQFKEEANYLPLGFRKIASTSQNIDEILEKTNDISKAFRQHAQSKAQAVAGAVYERNQDALKSNKMYIDLNMYSMLERTYTENEVKSRTARDVATISAMTSENNKDFVNAVPSAELRSQMRKKVYNYLVNVSEYQAADEVLGKRGKKFANYMTSLTVVSFFGASIEQIVKQSSALMNALIETRSMAARLEYIEAIADAITPAFVRGEKSWAIHNDKRRLMENFGISRRDVVTETLSVSDGKKIGTKSRFDRGVELSTAALRETDKVAATATWLAYYVDYLISEEGKKADDIDWAAEAANPNLDAGQFADQMTVKDQNINSRRDKSRINEMTKGSALNLVKMVAMPFANFLLNKKMNLALDFQKLTMGDAKNRKEGLLSLAGTLAEVTAFQASTWMLLAPLYQAVANALFGDDEEESWWDKNFGIQMVKRGLIMDLIPTPPIAAVENYVLKGINMATYALTADSEDFVFADEDWSKGFERWERLNGLPIFKGQGRGDMNIGGFLGMLGVTGSVAHEMYLSASNIESLSGKQPYYTSKSGQKRFVSRDDASKMLLVEFLRTSVNATMAVTGLHSKELSKILKEGKKPIEKRSTADQEQWIAKEIMSDAPAGIEDMLGYMAKEIEGDPTNAMGKVDQIIKKSKGSMVDDLVSAKNINTMRIIDKSETSNRGRAVYIHQIAQSLPEEERAQFYIDSYIYFGVKYGVETVKSQMLTEILKY